MTQKEFKHLLERFLQGRVTEDESRLVERWYAGMDAENGSPRLDEAGDELLHREDFQKIRNHIQLRRRFLGHWPSLAAAAVLLIGAVVGFYALQHQHLGGRGETVSLAPAGRFVNRTDQVKLVHLADSTIVALQPQSELSVDGEFNSIDRRVALKGEAFFTVARDAQRPFYVFAGDVITKVLGTSFNVAALSGEKKITVAVRTGKVSVYAATNEGSNAGRASVIVTPNQEVTYSADANELSRTLVADPEVIIPEEEVRKIRFEGAPVAEIFNALEKMYGVEIVFDEERFAACALTTSITGGSLYDKLDVVNEIIGATYSVEDARIIIRGTGCK